MERKDDHEYRGCWQCTACANLTKLDFRNCIVETFIVPHDCLHKTGVKPAWKPIECPLAQLLQWAESLTCWDIGTDEVIKKIKVIIHQRNSNGKSTTNGH